MKRRQSDDRYPGAYGGYDDQGYDRYDGGYDDGYDDGSGFQDDPFSEASAAVNHRVQAQQSQAKRKKKKKVRITVIVLVVLALLIGEFAILMNHWVSPPSLSDGDSDDVSVSTDGRKKGCYTFLIAGKDRAAGLTDTVLVGMLDTENQSLKFVSIPRDTAVNVSYKPKKMNQYYAAAENNGKDGVRRSSAARSRFSATGSTVMRSLTWRCSSSSLTPWAASILTSRSIWTMTTPVRI